LKVVPVFSRNQALIGRDEGGIDDARRRCDEAVGGGIPVIELQPRN
jgi:hypothetical protein